VTRNEEIIKAIQINNITPRIQKMMEQDIREAEAKRIKEILNLTNQEYKMIYNKLKEHNLI